MSALRSKLAKLRVQTGGHLGSSPDHPANDAAEQVRPFRERLKRLSPNTARYPTSRARLCGPELAEQLGGHYATEGLIVIERTVPFGLPHGACRIGDGLEESLGFFGHAGSPTVFLDTETTGLAGGTGTVVFLLGLAKIAGNALHITQYLLTQFQGEAALLEHGEEFIRGAKTFVTYNGKSFDHPLLTTRYRLAGLRDPFTALAHIDALHHTRRAFRHFWPDCSLTTAERKLLGFVRVGDLPGSEAPQAWFDWLRYSRMESLPGVIEHNGSDLLSLSALLPRLSECYQNPGPHDTDIRAVARHFQRERDEASAYEYLLANREFLNTDAALELARLARRRKEWELAVDTWHGLAANENLEAIERLAKYYEHVDRDIPLAIRLTRQLLQLDRHPRRHEHREKRLLAKLHCTL